MHNYKELKLWEKSMELVTEVYMLTGSFPKSEAYSITSQINRSAVSIASNVAEGAGRNSDKEFVQFLGVAHGSTYELETQLIIARNLGYILDDELKKVQNSIVEIQKMNYALQKALRERK
ncbi:four helix bundle protein [Sphingobacterium lactis]|uniref:four helix bundle protein n=1 Tax=Sphingobacterium lactis TaxID=797291 RepID=UPI003DA65F8E